MSLKINILSIITLTLHGCNPSESQVVPVVEDSYLIEADDLLEIIDRPNIKLIDFRNSEMYSTAHIENAVNIGRNDLQNNAYDYKGMMANKDQIEALLGNLGIGSEDTLVVYDDNGLCNAARLWWILQNYDFHQVKLLHGGLPAWKIAGGQVTDKVTQLAKSHFKLSQNSSMKYYSSKDNVISALDDKSIFIDCRTADEFSGKRQKKGALKGGRIPGSVHIDWAEAINYDGDKRMKSEENLRSIYQKLSDFSGEPIIVYCHTGMRSAHTTFVLTELLGYENVKNYDGSWTEWSSFDELPNKQDSLTTIF